MGKLFTPVGLGVTTAAAAVVGLTAAAIEGYREQERLAHSIVLTGNYAGTTTGQVNALANSLGSINGRGGAARDILNGLIDSGRVAGDALNEVGRAAVNQAAISGDSAKQVVTEWAKIADDPVKGVTELDQRFHFLNITTFQHIQDLQQAGDKYGALKVAAAAFADDTAAKMDQLHQHMGWIETLADRWSRGVDAIKTKALDLGKPPTEIDKFSAALDKYNKTYDAYWYRIAYHMGLGIGPFDAFLEFRGGDKTAWSGELTASGTIKIDKPKLWGGESDQGGIVGDLDVMFGDAAQLPNAYLLSTFGSQVPSWQGVGSVVFKGGRYGALNPYPQKASYKIRKITKGWDNDVCWYPSKAVIPMGDSSQIMADTAFPGTSSGIIPALNGIVITGGFTASDTLLVFHEPGMTYQAWSRFDTDSVPTGRKPWTNEFWVSSDGGSPVSHWAGEYDTKDEAEAAVSNQVIRLTGATSYLIGLMDTQADDNRGGLSLRVYKNSIVAAINGMNPAHILYYARTHSTIGRVPVEQINDASFRAAADFYFAQGFGLCTEYDPSKETLADFEQRIEKVAGCSVSRNPVDGQYYIDVANGIYPSGKYQVWPAIYCTRRREQPGACAAVRHRWNKRVDWAQLRRQCAS